MRHQRSDLQLLALWTKARIKLLLRTRRAAFFTFVFPLIFLLLFNALNGGNHVQTDAGRLTFAQYFTPSIAIFGLTTSCYTGVIFAVATARERGVLKRVRSTPLPPWVYLGAMIAGVIVSGVASVLLMFAVGIPVFDVHIYPRLLPAAIVTLLIGGLALASLGLAVSTMVDKAESAPAVANLTLLPLTFISGVFYPMHGAPQWLRSVANVFPLAHIVDAFDACFSPVTKGLGFSWGDLGVCVLWGIAGARIAQKRFRFEPAAGADVPPRRLAFGRRSG